MIRGLQFVVILAVLVSWFIADAAPAPPPDGQARVAASASSQPAASQSANAVSAFDQFTITRYGIVASPTRPLFRRLAKEFSTGQFGPYRVLTSNPKTRTLVVSRDAIDSDSWTKWASCKVGPLAMLDSLQDGSATITISLAPVRRITDAAVAAGFEGRYSITPTSSTSTVRCSSRGVLEKELLTAITTSEATRPQRVAKR